MFCAIGVQTRGNEWVFLINLGINAKLFQNTFQEMKSSVPGIMLIRNLKTNKNKKQLIDKDPLGYKAFDARLPVIKNVVPENTLNSCSIDNFYSITSPGSAPCSKYKFTKIVNLQTCNCLKKIF